MSSSPLFAPACSITKTKRGRFFWAAWWSGAPAYVPFRKPDAEGGAARSREEARAAAEKSAGRPLVEIDALWARAWMRILRGQPPWPGKASREPRAEATKKPRAAAGEAERSIWSVLGVAAHASDAELKEAYRKKALETHPDHGGDAESFRRVVAAYDEARRRRRRPKRKVTR